VNEAGGLLDLAGAVLDGGLDQVDLAEAASRVAWSTLVEPGDGLAGGLVAGVGAGRSLLALRARCEAGPGNGSDGCDDLLALALDAQVPGSEDPVAYADALASAVERWAPRVAVLDPTAALAAAAAVGARLLVPGCPGWPERVDDLDVHAPVVLWARGRPEVVRPSLSVVGSRANTVAGAEAAAEITSLAADAGCSVVSGGAYGIDAVAHRVSIAAGAPTTAVLAGGIDQLYPAGNADLLRNVSRQGAVLAESPPGTRPTRWRFLARNRLIAALGDATVVVEAGARSGALNTAHHAGQLGRPVFAVPGAFSSSASVGCHRLVADGRAQLVVRPEDPVRAVVEPAVGGGAVGGGAVHTPGPRGRPSGDGVDGDGRAAPLVGARLDAEVLRVLDALARRPLPEHEVVVRSGMSPSEVADALALAELQGLATHTASGWVRA